MTQPRKEQLNVLKASWSKITISVTAGDATDTIPAATLQAASITGVHGGSASSSPVRGILTTADGYNLVKIRSNSNEQALLAASGEQLYGRLTFAGGAYVVSYFIISSGVETSTTLPGTGSYNMDILFPEVMNFGEIPAYSGVVDQAGFVGASPAGASQLGPTGQMIVQGVSVTPGWTVVGAFYLDPTITGATFTLEGIALVSTGALTGNLRLYDTVAAAAVTSSTITIGSATTDTRVISGNLKNNMTTGRIYQFQAECTGGNAVSDYIVVREMRLIPK